MEQCVINIDGRLLGSINIIILACCLAITVLSKNFRHAVFVLSLLSFYLFSYSFHCDFKSLSFDPNNVNRYVVWSLIDIVFLLVVYFLCKKKLCDWVVFAVCLFLETVAISMHMIRMVDKQITNYNFSDYFYSEVIQLTNLGFVFLAVLPTLFYFVRVRGIG